MRNTVKKISLKILFFSVIVIFSSFYFMPLFIQTLGLTQSQAQFLSGERDVDCFFTGSSKNDILISQSSQESIFWKMNLIKHAQQSIELSGCFCGGAIFDAFLELAAERLRICPKLQVRILSMEDLVTASNRKLIKMLETEFPERFYYLETARRIQFFPTVATFENHEKLLIVDEKYFVIGGSNFSDQSNTNLRKSSPIENLSFIDWLIGAAMNDIDAVIAGPLARSARLDFYRLWGKWKGYQNKGPLVFSSEYFPVDRCDSSRAAISEFDLDNPRVIRNAEMFFVSGGPENSGGNLCAKILKQIFDGAKQTIFIGNMVFNENKLIDCLYAATLRDVFVTVITNGNRLEERSIGKRALGAANRYNYSRLGKNRAVFYEYNISAEVYHKKVFVIDKEIVAIGSMNISTKSVFCDDESMLVVYSKEAAEIVEAVLAKDMEGAIEVSAEEIDSYQRGWDGIIGRVISWVNKYRMN